jgi:hypothetical protein
MLETTTRAFGSPMTYYSGPGEFNNLRLYKNYSDMAFYLMTVFC